MLHSEPMPPKPRLYPADIDMACALAFYECRDNGNESSWAVIDRWVADAGPTRVLQDIARIMDHLNLTATEQARELTLWQCNINRRIHNATNNSHS